MRGIVSGIMLSLLLTSMLTLAFNIEPVKAEPRTWIVDDDGPADFHTIQEAINSPEVMDGDTINVCNGIYYENVVVNKTVSLVGENRNSTFLEGGRSGTVLKVVTEKVVVSGFTIRHSGRSWPDSGVLIESDANYISNNTIEGNEHGILLCYSSGNILRNNHIIKNRRNFGVWAWQSASAVFLLHFVHDIDTSNTVNGKPIYYFVNQDNLVISPDSFPEIGYLGIVNSTNIVVKGVKLKSNFQGVLFAYTTHSSIQGSDVSGNSFGVNIFSSSNITVEDNAVDDTHGVQIHSSLHCTISHNNISAISGINLEANSQANNIISNTINSEMFGMYVGEANGNTIYHNNFINNPRQVYSYISINTWDKEYPFGGNYWSDYNGTDLLRGPYQNITGSDGIGDTPYVIDADNQDNYPLISPFVPSNITVSIYTDKYTYHGGDTMYLGLNVTNPDSVKYICIAIGLKFQDGSTYLYIHQHSVVLPIGLDYTNPSFRTTVLPSLPKGIYTWHAAFLERTNHKIIVEDKARWEFN